MGKLYFRGNINLFYFRLEDIDLLRLEENDF